jgi:hypothetical protein
MSTIILIALLTVVISIGIGGWFGVALEKVLTLIISTLIFQAAAAIVGVGLGLSPLLVIVLMTFVAVASRIAIFELSRMIEDRSETINAWVKNIHDRTRKFAYLRKYGVLMLVPTIWVPGIGLYGTPVVARIFGWDRSILASILCMVTGWLVATVFVMVTTLQIFLFFS